MSEAEIIHDAEVIGTELEPAAAGTLFRSDDPAEIIARASDLADKLAAVLRDRKLTSDIKGKAHVRVEGWTLLGTMLGVFPVVEWTRPVQDGWEARVEARTLAGQVVGAAEAECLRTEAQWKSRDDYALRSMAQTRAVSKALRGPLGFVVTLAGYEATPAEEMPAERLSGGSPAEDDDTEQRIRERVDGPKPLAPPKSWAKLTEMVGAYDAQVNEWFTQFVRSAVRYLFAPAQEPKDLKAKADKDRLFQVAAGAALHLREQFDPNEIPPPGLEDVRGAFALVLDVELAIPEEQLDDEAAAAAEREV